MKWKSGYRPANIAHTENMQNTICLGSTFKLLLKSKGLSLSTVSRETGIAYSTLHTWLDNRQPKDILKVKCLADYLEIGLHELLFGEADAKSKNQQSNELPSADLVVGTYEVTVRKRTGP